MKPTPIRLMHVVFSLQIGGAERLVVNFMRYVDRTRYRPQVCALEQGGPLVAELERLGVEVFVLSKRPGIDFRTLRQLARLLQQEQVEVLHTHNSAPFFYGALAGRWRRIPAVVHTQHSKLLAEQAKLQWLSPHLGRWVHHFISDADDVTEALLREMRLPPHKVSTILNGVDVTAPEQQPPAAETRAALGLGPDVPVIACVARLAEVKDHATLLRAFRQVIQAWPSPTLWLIGDGPLRAELEALTADLNLTDRVRFLGSRDDVAALLGAADVAVLSSRSEGLSLALLEAMAAGKPVVATRVGGNPEVLTEGETGRLVPPADPEALAAALLEVLDQPEQAAALGRAARSRVVERFSLQGMVTQYEQVYERLLRQGMRDER